LFWRANNDRINNRIGWPAKRGLQMTGACAGAGKMKKEELFFVEVREK